MSVRVGRYVFVSIGIVFLPYQLNNMNIYWYAPTRTTKTIFDLYE